MKKLIKEDSLVWVHTKNTSPVLVQLQNIVPFKHEMAFEGYVCMGHRNKFVNEFDRYTIPFSEAGSLKVA